MSKLFCLQFLQALVEVLVCVSVHDLTSLIRILVREPHRSQKAIADHRSPII